MNRPVCRYLACVLLLFPVSLSAETLRGIVQDDKGVPVPNVRVDVAMASPKAGASVSNATRYPDCVKWTRTDKQGKFEIDGLDPNLTFRVSAAVPGKQSSLSELIDPVKELATLVLNEFPAFHPFVEGRVVDPQGTPIPGAIVEPIGAQTREKRWWGQVELKTVIADEQGQFRLDFPEGYLGVDLKISADGFAGTSTPLVGPGRDVREFEIPRGATVQGRIAFEGKPVADMRLAVVQLDRRAAGHHFIEAIPSITTVDGRFEFKNLPAGQRYAIFSLIGDSALKPQELVLATKTFACPGNDETRDLGTLELQKGFTIAGRLEMSDGSPLPSGIRLRLNRDPAWDWMNVPVAENGRFIVTGLGPETYEFMLKGNLQFDPSRLKFQITRGNSTFGMRLSKSYDDLVIPLITKVAATQSKPVQDDAKSTQPNADDDFPEISSSTRVATGGNRREVELTEEPCPADGPTINVRGTAISNTGQRVAKAKVILRAKIGGTFNSTGHLHNRDVLARTTTDSNGRFILSEVPIPLHLSREISNLISGRGGAEIIAYADGFGLSAVDVESMKQERPLRIVLPPEAEIRGIVQDDVGNPIPLTRVELAGLTKAGSVMNPLLQDQDDINLLFSQIDLSVKTDKSGAFVLKNIPVNARAILRFGGGGFQNRVIAVDTWDRSQSVKLPMTVLKQSNDIGNGIEIQKSPLEVRLNRGNSVLVRVLNHDGTPADRGVIEVLDANNRRATGLVDRNSGEVRLLVETPGLCSVNYATDPLTSGVGLNIWTNISKEDDAMALVRLPEIRWLTGRVINLETGEPVVGALVHARAINRSDDSRELWSKAISRDKGVFRIPVPLGDFQISAAHNLYGFVSELEELPDVVTKGIQVNVTKVGDLPELILKMTSGTAFEGIVVNANGQAVPNCVVTAEQTEGSFSSTAAHTDEQGRFRIAGFSSTAKTLITAVSGGTGDRIFIADADTDRRNLRLTVTEGIQLKGRVLRRGKTISGIKMELTRSMPGQPNSFLVYATVTTDDEGRYVVGGLSPDDGFQFRIITRDGSSAPAWKYQLPFAQRIPAEQIDAMELPDAILVSSKQSIHGTVIDPDGKPVADVTVTARLARGQQLPFRQGAPRPWVETNDDGTFELEQLPEENLELMVYKRGPGGSTIRFPAQAAVAAGETVVRIVYDPALAADVEDLDKK